MDQTRIPDATPEQLLKMLDAQLVAKRTLRSGGKQNQRIAILIGGVFLILAGCGAALLFMQYMIAELPPPEDPLWAKGTRQTGEVKNN